MVADKIAKMASLEVGLMSMELNMEVQKFPNIEEVPTFAI